MLSDVCVGSVWQVNEPDYTIQQVEIRKGDGDASEAVGDKAPIRHEVKGDAEGTTSGSGGFGGADTGPADQTLAGDLSQDADASVVKETAVSSSPISGLCSSPLSASARRVASFLFFRFSLCFRVSLVIERVRMLIPIFHLLPCNRTFPSMFSKP